VEQN